MRFGVCTSSAKAAEAAAGGWDFVEENVQGYLRGLEPEWSAPARAAVPVPSANAMVPGQLKITGPDAKHEPLLEYMTRVLTRANAADLRTIVFGSGAARNVPDGWDRTAAVSQIAAFLNAIAPVAQANNVTIVIEPLNRGECNIINTVAEAMTYVRKVNHPNIQCLVDSYHMWLEDEPLSNLKEAMPWIKHVHLADKDGRVAPGESGKSDYKPFFNVLKQGNYDGLISIECGGFDFATNGPRVQKYIKDTWTAA